MFCAGEDGPGAPFHPPFFAMDAHFAQKKKEKKTGAVWCVPHMVCPTFSGWRPGAAPGTYMRYSAGPELLGLAARYLLGGEGDFQPTTHSLREESLKSEDLRI